LFNIYADSLLICLQGRGWGIDDLLGFADDHPGHISVEDHAERSYYFGLKMAEETNINLNTDKSGILVFKICIWICDSDYNLDLVAENLKN